MKSWWYWLAKEEKRQPRAATRPPMTAVSLVDFLLHTPIVSGERKSETETQREQSQAGNDRKRGTCPVSHFGGSGKWEKFVFFF